MIRLLSRGSSWVLGLIGLCVLFSSPVKADERLALVQTYLDLVTSRNYESASPLKLTSQKGDMLLFAITTQCECGIL